MMQLFELVLLAIIALLIISKLLSVLGIVDDEDRAPAKKIIDVTIDTGDRQEEYKDYSQFTSDKALQVQINRLENEILNFDFGVFLTKVKKVFGIVVRIDAQAINQDIAAFSSIIDESSMTRIMNHARSYSSKAKEIVSTDLTKIDVFGNRAMITLNFKTVDIDELWTFKKNLNNDDPTWYLTEVNAN